MWRSSATGTAYYPAVDEQRRTRMLVKALDMAKRIGIDREDRIGLAEMILRRDVPSWKALSEEELTRVLDALEGYVLIAHVVGERQP